MKSKDFGWIWRLVSLYGWAVEGFAMEEIKSFFTSRGLGTSELAKGLVIHEVPSSFQTASEYEKITYQVLGVAILFSAWGGCYFLRPSARSHPLHLEAWNRMRKSIIIESICVSRILSQRFMTVLKNKNHKQWKQAQARISVSPLASRISGYEYGGPSYHLVFFLKVSSPREGCSCGPRFWRKCLSQKTTHANPGRWILWQPPSKT